MTKISSVGIFGSRTRTNALLTIHLLKESHASEVARAINVSLSQAQKAVDSLERAGVVVGVLEGTARRLRLNPRFLARPELEALLTKLSEIEPALQERLAEIRRRPRRASKPL